MSRIGYKGQCSIGLLKKIFNNITNDSDIVVRSAICSRALLNENTGIYGCELLEAECPYGEPDTKRCISSGCFTNYDKMKIFIPKIRKKR